ncbi:CAF17 [Candida margitis]|uniref:CAF17 n=1 Tax=Candida margitis TaxID=1775924 RepID=UPI0022270865|nr:CAF17 [Candida margitis]KAI5970369.1 CAF17 [Candida margitis]
MKILQSGLSQLSKSLISIRGPDATKFLNGLLTSRLLPNVVKKKQHTISSAEFKHANLEAIIDPVTNYGLMHEDIYDPDYNIFVTREGINSMILNSKGRVVTDCFLYCDPFHNFKGQFEEEIQSPRYLLEVDEVKVNKLMMMLKLHKLSAKVDIKSEPSLFSYYYYNDTVEFDSWLEMAQQQYFRTLDPVNALQSANSFIQNDVVFNQQFASRILGFAVDNRIPNFGFKFVTDAQIDTTNAETSVPEVFSTQFTQQFETQIISESSVTGRRFQNGVFETTDAPDGESLLPFECNLDYTNGLSLDKGCYVGQELTIRTYNNGIIRKRIYPVQFFTLDEATVKTIKQAQDDDDVEVALASCTSLDQIPSSSLSKLEMAPMFEEAEPEESTTSVAAASPFGSSSKPVRKRKSSSGKVLAVRGDVGLCLLSMADVAKSPFYKIEMPSFEDGKKVIGARAVIPDWWPE